MFRHSVVIGSGHDQIFTIQAALFAKLVIILRHLLPAFGFGAANGDDHRTDRQRGMKGWTVLSGDLWGHPHLFVDADPHHHVEIVNPRSGGRALDEITREAFFLPFVSQSHGDEMATCGMAGDVELRRIAAVTYDVSVNPSD